MSLRSYKTIEERRKFIGERTGLSFKAIKIYPKDFEKAQFSNCENMVGAVQVPLGIAGPISIHGEYAKGDYYIPLATTEGALVASVNRGCKVICRAGQVRVFTENTGMTRGPVFQTKGIKESLELKRWLVAHFNDLNYQSEKTSSHLKLQNIQAKVVGRNVFVRFSFDTQDAMGMNMVTIATEEIVRFVKKETGSKCISLAGNFDIDKKPAWLNFILGRGRQVWAETTLDKQIVKEVLRVTPAKIHQVVKSKCLLGSIISGSLGFNAHFANIVAAMFIALGQDVAHTVEGSIGITTTEIIDGNLYISVYLPDLAVGTVGGGTNLPSQKEALDILRISGGNQGKNAQALAEIVGGAVLAGEISLLAALAQGSLVSAHQKLARRHKLLR